MITICEKCKCKIEFEKIPMLKDFKPKYCDPCVEIVNRQKQEEERANYLQRKKEILIDRSGIPIPLMEYDMQKGNKHLLHWISSNKDRWLWIGGENRIGKTRAATYAAYQTIVQSMKKVVWINTPAEMICLMALKQSDPVKAQRRYSQLWYADLLVIDDIGKEKMTAAKAECLWTIIDVRHVNNRRTWITTNLSGSRLADRIGADYGVGMVGRLKEVCKIWPESSSEKV